MIFNKQALHNETFWMKTAVIGFVGCVLIAFLYLQTTHMVTPLVPSPTPTPVPASSANITVYSPSANDRINQTIQVIGKARVFENVVSIRLKQRITGHVLFSGTSTTDAQQMGTYGAFTYTAQLPEDFSLKSGDPLLLEVFQLSAKDGSENDKIIIPLKFIPE
jgi:hypothetical protein